MNRREGVEFLIHERRFELAVSMLSLHVEVRDDEIIVTQSGSEFKAVYHFRPPHARGSTSTDREGHATGNTIFSLKLGRRPMTRRASRAGSYSIRRDIQNSPDSDQETHKPSATGTLTAYADLVQPLPAASEQK